MKQYVCGICGYIHDEAVGGKWEDLPADWKCPVCKAGNGTVQLVQDASQKIDGGYGMVFIHMNLLNDGTPESSAIFL